MKGSLHEDQYTFLIISRPVILELKMFETKVVEKLEKHEFYVDFYLSKIVPFMS